MSKHLTAAEVQQHPEYPHIHWQLKPREKGTIEAARGRGGPLKIAYEIHGHGDTKLVWIMGLGGLRGAWQRQTKDFAHTQGATYSSLIIDNRGMGESSKPLGRYSTSEMARDILEVIDHVGWTAPRQLNVVGISMGGMIAQELAVLAPARIHALLLTSTAARLVNTIGFVENLRNRVNLFVPKSLDTQIAHSSRNMYTLAWLERPDDGEWTVQPFPTNRDRFAAGEISKRSSPDEFNRAGFISQALAAGWHHKSPQQLRELADKVGRERICVVHGTEDRMITFPHAEVLLEELGGEEGGVTKAFFEGQNHVIPIELRREYHELIERVIEKARRLPA